LRATASTRPTADLIKGVIFSMLEALAYKRGFEPDEDGNLAAALAWPRALDLYAGSGGLGIEALSRGCQHATFVEHDREAARVITANLKATGLEERAQLLVGPVHVSLTRVRGPMDVVFADPPYRDAESLPRTVELLSSMQLLLATSIVVLEQPATAEPPREVGPLALSTTRTHGRTRVTLYAS
jgi:16S rRNA (guanine966-N2)-methyltransferase